MTISRNLAAGLGSLYVAGKITAESVVANNPAIVSLSQSGELAITTGVVRWYAPAAITVNSITARLASAADSTVTVAVKKNASTAVTINIATSETIASDTSGVVMALGDYLTVDVSAVGTSVKGTGLNVQFSYTYN